MMKLYNTLSEEKEDLPKQKKLRLFVCGPTVYDYAHIGHARTYLFFDFFAHYLRTQGYEVMYLQNITDIDDKIISRAAEENRDPRELSKEFTDAYLEAMQALGIEMTADEQAAKKSGAVLYAPATEFIPQIATQVERLIDRGFAYEIEGDGWYFDISKDEGYGKLSHRTAEQAEDSLSRIDNAIGKRNKGDFCLWKFSKPGEPSWTTRLGAGRPGWHIEDTAISEFYFGPQYEIHGGGVDLKFPHHEAEIAQQESASGRTPFVRIWMHVGTLLVGGKKMSKSVGNSITIRDFLKKYPAEVLRWIVLTHHYRSPIDFSDESAMQAKAAIENIRRFLARLTLSAKENPDGSQVTTDPIISEIDHAFQESLADDLNVPEAIGHLFQHIADVQSRLRSESTKIMPEHARALLSCLEQKLHLLGFSIAVPKIPLKIRELAAEREQSRASKQFEHSDRLRKGINDLGYEVEDTPQGPFLWPNSD